MRKGQITLFVILGIVLLVVVAYMLFLARSIPDESGGIGAAINELESGTVREHVSDCASGLLEEGLERISANGGMVYEFEGGKVPFSPSGQHLPFTGHYVSYGIRENSYCPYVSRFAPDYPLDSTPLSQLQQRYSSEPECAFNSSASDYDGFFGQIALPKLCDDGSCEPFARGAVWGLTVQRQLEDFIDSGLDLCIDIEGFEDRLGVDMEQERPASSNVTIRGSEVIVKVALPLTVAFEKESVSRLFEYQASSRTRLGDLYYFMFDVLSRDVRDHAFDPVNGYIISPRWKEGFVVARHKDACPTCDFPANQDDVLEFIDSSSMVKSRPFSWKVAVQNRRPALDPLPAFTTIDIDSNPERSIPINAYDPDDGRLEYVFLSQSFEGWREDEAPIRNAAEGVFIDLVLSSRDIGNRTVGIVTVDDSGFYDYQWFTIDIKGTLPPGEQSCVDSCEGFTGWDLHKTTKELTCPQINNVPVVAPVTEWRPPQPNGWFPQFSPDGRYVGYGFGETFVADLDTGIERFFNLSSTGQVLNHSFTVGWIRDDTFSFVNYGVDTRRYEINVRDWQAVVTQDDPALVAGNAHSAADGHWASGLGDRFNPRIAYDNRVLTTGVLWKVVIDQDLLLHITNIAGSGLTLWRDGERYRTYNTRTEPYEIELNDGYIAYGGYGPIWGINPAGRELPLHITPGAFEGAASIFFYGNQTWVSSIHGMNNADGICWYVMVRSWGSSFAIPVLGEGVHTDSLAQGDDALVAFNDAKGRLRVVRVPIDSPMVAIKQPSSVFEKAGRYVIHNETHGYDQAPSCGDFCSVAASACSYECFANFEVPGTDCSRCVLSSVYDDFEENHIDCDSFDYSAEDCISNMPDCFWVSEGNAENGNCYDDSLLFVPKHPAYLFTD